MVTISLPATDTMIVENLNGSSAIRTEYTGHKTKGKHCCILLCLCIDFHLYPVALAEMLGLVFSVEID